MIVYLRAKPKHTTSDLTKVGIDPKQIADVIPNCNGMVRLAMTSGSIFFVETRTWQALNDAGYISIDGDLTRW